MSFQNASPRRVKEQMEIPSAFPYAKPSSPLTFFGEDSIERRSSIIFTSMENKVVELCDPIDAISCNQTQDKIVCAGSRGVLRVFAVRDHYLQLLTDLKKVAAKNKSRTPLLYSPSNVAWSKLRNDLIATTSTIGAVVLWNVDGSRIENHWKAHTRSATVVRFHRYNSDILISGSKDSCMFVYDIREQLPVQEYRRGITETVRDLTFSMIDGDEYHFLTADDGGFVKVWDMRNNQKHIYARCLHQGYVSCIQSNPKRPYEVASGGGRDKQVKIWNWKDNSSRYRSVETYAPVGRINWRPDNEYQFATCAVVNDMSVLVWDTRRPHLPMVSFPGHKDSVTDLFWSRIDPFKFVSVGKDGLAILHHMTDGDLTIDHLCDAQVDIAPDGLIIMALNSENELKKSPKWEIYNPHIQLQRMRNSSEKRREACARALEKRSIQHQHQVYEPFSHNVRTDVTVGIPSSAQYALQNKLFEVYAKNFILGGKTIADMCEQNACICAQQLDQNRERIWRYVASLLEDTGFQEIYEKEAEEQRLSTEKKWKIYIKEHENQGSVPLIPPKPKPDLPFSALVNMNNVKNRINPLTTKLEDEKIHEFFTSLDKSRPFLETIPDPLALTSEEPPGDEFCGLPEEAFGYKRYFQDPSVCPLTEKDSWRNDKERRNCHPERLLARTLHYLAQQGDMQLCATIATIAGHQLTKTLSDYFIEVWVQSYVDMLYRLQVLETIAAIRKYTCVRRIRDEGNEGVFQRTIVYHPKKNPSWGYNETVNQQEGVPQYVLCKGRMKNGNCDKCTNPVKGSCVLCDQVITGLIYTCNKCNHSMHLDHAYTWWRKQIKLTCKKDKYQYESLLQRRYKLMKNDKTKITEVTNELCPAKNCDCKCLEPCDETARNKRKKLPPKSTKDEFAHSLISGERQVPDFFGNQKKQSLLNNVRLKFKKPQYEGELIDDEKLLKTVMAAVKTHDELKLYILLKWILIIPEEKRKEVKKRLMQKKDIEREREKKMKEQEEAKPKEKQKLVVLLGLTTEERIREKRLEKGLPLDEELDKRERLTKPKRKARLRIDSDPELISSEDERAEDKGEKTKYKHSKMPKPLTTWPTHEVDTIRCIFQPLFRKMMHNEEQRMKHLKRKKEHLKAEFETVIKVISADKKHKTIERYIKVMSRIEKESRHLFKIYMKRAAENIAIISNFVHQRQRPFFIRRGNRLFAQTKKGAPLHYPACKHLKTVQEIRRFAVEKKSLHTYLDTYGKFPILRHPPNDMIPDVIEEFRARQISTTRHTAVSSGPATPRPTDYQI